MYSGCMNVKRMVRMFSVLGSIVGIALWQYKLTLDFKSTGLGTEDCPLGSSRMAVASSIGMRQCMTADVCRGRLSLDK